MMAPLGFACIAWLVFVCSLALRPALAGEFSRPADRRCDESLVEAPPAEPSPPQAELPPQNPVSAPRVPPPPIPIPSPPSQPSFFVLWPMEYVLRPQTVPAGMIELGGSAWVFRPQSDRLTAADGTPYTFNSSLMLGFWGRVGVTDRLALGFSAPQALCWSRAEPSGCSEINRHNGTGPSLAYGLVRSRAFQIMVFGSLTIARSAEPLIWVWTVGTRSKLLIGKVLAVETALAFGRRIEPGSSQIDPSARTSFLGELNLQATRHLYVFAAINPYAPVDHLGEAALEVWGGTSWSFWNQTEIVVAAGSYNVLAKRSWDDNVPGTFARLSMLSWF